MKKPNLSNREHRCAKRTPLLLSMHYANLLLFIHLGEHTIVISPLAQRSNDFCQCHCFVYKNICDDSNITLFQLA